LFGWNAPTRAPKTKEEIFNDLKVDVHCLDDNSERPDFMRNLDKLLSQVEFRDPNGNWPPPSAMADERPTQLFLDGEFAAIERSLVAIDKGGTGDPPQVDAVLASYHKPRTNYGLHGNTTVVHIDDAWWAPKPDGSDGFDIIRSTRVLCGSEQLPLAEEPEPEYLQSGSNTLELNALIGDFLMGQRLIIVGEPIVKNRNTSATQAELIEISHIEQRINSNPPIFGDRYHTHIHLVHPLQHTYKRNTVRIYANVVEATHGETHREVLGSGDSAKAFQAFGLQRPEVSRLPAPTPNGTDAVLRAYVNDVEWRKADGFTEIPADAEQFVSVTDDALRRTLVFGDGENGARVPTGTENVRTTYRTGLGNKGNVAAGQIDQAIGAPLGVRKVVNPLPARGGADPDDVDMVRDRAPLALTAMDRLVSIQDFADFARNYAGIGKASSARMQGLVHITIAGMDSQPFDMDGPLVRNLRQALVQFGDPSQRFELHDREAGLLIVVAKVGIKSGGQWDKKIEPAIRNALLKTFSYEKAELGRDILLSDAIDTIQSIEGVRYVDIDTFDKVDQNQVTSLASCLSQLRKLPRIHVPMERLENGSTTEGECPITQNGSVSVIENVSGNEDQTTTAETGVFHPAQLCYLPHDIQGALLLEQI
jgi:predicted phage baseplate assembly protein